MGGRVQGQRQGWVQNPTLLPPSVVTLSTGPHAAVPLGPPRKRGSKNTVTFQGEWKFQGDNVSTYYRL